MSALTAETVHHLTEHLRPQTAEVVLLIFVQDAQGEYLMAAPYPCSWSEAIAAMRVQPCKAKEQR